MMKRIVFFIFFSLLFVISAFSQNDLQAIAVVNLIRSEPVTVRQLKTEVDRVEKANSGRALTIEGRKQILDVMINERLVLQASERDKILVTDNELNQQIQQLRNEMARQIGRAPSDDEFAQAIKNESSLDITAFRDQIRKQMIIQKYIMNKKGTLINSVKTPTDQEIISEYTLLKGTLVRPETVRFSMIQILYGPDAASRTNAKKLADDLIREIGTNPTKFDEVAARGAAPNSGYKAGDAGYLPRNQEARNIVGQNLMDTVFNLRQGQVSSLVEGVQGFHIVKVTENYAQKNLELDDILQLGSTLTVRNYISQGILNQRQQRVLAQASEEITRELRAGRSFQINENLLNW
jgi:parvulin-like peptidyl-prolyl isomerase